MGLGRWTLGDGPSARCAGPWASGLGRAALGRGRGPWAGGHGRFAMGEDGDTGGGDDDVLGEAGISDEGSAGYDSADDDLLLVDLRVKCGMQRAGAAKISEIQLLFSIGYDSSLDCVIIVYSIVVESQTGGWAM